MTISTRKSLAPVENDMGLSRAVPPTTPGTKVRQLTTELQTKESENETLRENVTGLVKALGKMELIKDSASVAPSVDDNKKKKNSKPAVVPAKSAYKFWSDAQQTKKEGANMQQLWKEADPKVRDTYGALAKADKARYQSEMETHEQERTALEMYREQQKQKAAMEFYEAHLEAQAALVKAAQETTTTDGKKKKKKIAKDPDAPKRSMSSYMFFAQDMRASVVAEHPDAKVTEISKILGELWNTLDKTKGGKKGAKQYEDMAAVDRERYHEEKAVYDAKLQERKLAEERDMEERRCEEKKQALELMESQSVQYKQIHVVRNGNGDDVSMISDVTGTKKVANKKKKDPNAPKRALSAYNYFMSENREPIKTKLPETATNSELLTEIGKQWKSITDKKKAKYTKLAAKDQERYAKQMEEYNKTKAN